MTARGPGWYADPDGLPGAFRWWDGTNWTDVLTSDAGSPPPDEASAGAVPPPPGAPGPGYLPYDGFGTDPRPGGEPATEVLSGGEAPAGGPRRSIAVAVVVLVIAVAGVAYLAYFRGGGDAEQAGSAATPSETPGETRPSDASPPAAGEGPGDRPEPDGGNADPNEIPDRPRLEFTALPNPWTADSAAANVLTSGQAQTQVTEKDYQDTSSWVALVATGAADPEWFNADDLAGSARTAADWFADEGFTGAEVTQQIRSSRPLTVDGRPAYRLDLHFTYRIEGLRSRGEAITIVLVDLGGGAGGIFLASIPDTHAGLRGDVGKAMATLTITD